LKKKRREIENFAILDLRKANCFLYEAIALKTNAIEKEGVTMELYSLDTHYGSGDIHCLKTKDINIVLSKFKLKKDLTYIPSLKQESIHINFLLTGEKIIFMESHRDLMLESRESFMAGIKNYEGPIKLFGKKPFTEIKITLPLTFLMAHGFINTQKLKALSDDHLVLPITDELFSILENLERKAVSKAINKIYINAKVFELMALFFENYKNTEGHLKLSHDKTLKKMYHIKQLIKSNLHKNLSLHELALEVGVNGHTLNKEFERVFGCTINEFSTS